jgi:hypothetical protein
MPEIPRHATLDDDGWILVDAEQGYAARDQIYWLPAQWEREHLEEHVPDGGYVKLIFRIQDPEEPHAPATERMWVIFRGQIDGRYHGHLANTPYTAGTAHEGMPVWFGPEHVIDYASADGENQASARSDVVQCQSHGASEPCYLCEHIEMHSFGRGFNTAVNAESQRPDAWCDACDELLEGVDDWEALGDRHPKIRVVCGGCYDALRERHELPYAS